MFLLLIFSALASTTPADSTEAPVWSGEWERIQLLVDGAEQPFAPAGLGIGIEGGFLSTTPGYYVEGDIEVEGGNMTWTVSATNAPGPIQAGSVTEYEWSVSSGGDTLTISTGSYGVTVTEMYVRGPGIPDEEPGDTESDGE